MKTGIFHIFFLVLIAWGCSRDDSAPDPAKGNIPGQKNLQDRSTYHTGNRKAKDFNFTRFTEDANREFPAVADSDSPGEAPYYDPVQVPGINLLRFPAPGHLQKLNAPKMQRMAKRPDYYQGSNFFRGGSTAQQAYFSCIFDNDLFDYTDYYYTSGITFELFHPSLRVSPLYSLLPGLKGSINFYSLSLVQNMYTPRKLNFTDILMGDRPFASYLTLGHRKYALAPGAKRRIESEFTLGVIGPASMGSKSQDLIHTEEPVGWMHQVKNDLVMNYTLRFEQGLISHGNLDISIFAGGQAGTLYDNLQSGVIIQTGRSNGRFESLFLTTDPGQRFNKRIRYFFNLEAQNKLVLYDATLQGGTFNRDGYYKLDSDQVKRYVFTGKAGVGIGLGRYSLEAEQVFLSSEFVGGRHHFWFRIRNIFYLN